ncbi:hypothetical protein [Ralstonia solanacearum]|uniref:Uncharacterized protein n=1 Tax=Ralstonia solanacearum (strain Po82) TaxID=1031711 RepID=F6G5E3_RALS8|nr:hypothetical protein [Ralstonia solanacearum]AEG70244.1 conserved hypothetical protein [Ralstonia solanacearum Po82]AMP68371.1 hypothetical protein UW163_02210 [Ralstonia solanacearum]AMP74720.1 hypothetical protein RALBFv3_11365 [Ralstonia solanacearum]AYB61657.1 hypothetical protein C2124_14420 [Ralstonia solanacearum]MBB6585450.1 hypothetical protein [Ralstonia solanacearum]
MRSDNVAAGLAAWVCACGLAAWPAAMAMAADDVPVADASLQPSVEAARPPVAAATVVQGFGRAVDTSALESYRGGTQTLYQTVNDARLSGTVTDNAAINVATGANIVRDGSFANASGIPTIIQNTGANVLIQNATIVNVQFRP